MRLGAWGFCMLLVVLSISSQPHSHITGNTGNTGTPKYLSKAYFCSADVECAPRLYCQAPGHAHSQCSPCKRRARRCHRDSMCCPGNECREHVCVRGSARVLTQHTPGRLKTNRKKPRRGESGALCVRSADCRRGLCCARHLWKRVCKAEPQEGQVCSTAWRPKHTHTVRRVELFQLCPCTIGLECRTQSHTPTHTHTHSDTHTHTHSNTHTDTHSDTHTHTHSNTHTDTHSDTHTPTHSNTHRPATSVRLHTCQQL